VAITSLGFRTDIMLLALSGSQVREEDGLTVVSTPANPTFWWGNFVLAGDLSRVLDAVHAHGAAFPGADFVSIGVDGTDQTPGIDAVAAAHGLQPDCATVLSATSVAPPPRPNAEATVRRLEGDADFAQCADLQVAGAPEDGRAFVEQRVAAWRALQDAGHGAWFGAFLDGTMRAGLGVFTDGSGVARYQAVDTHPDFRGRGLAGTLVHRAGSEALAWPGVQTLVIAADPEYHAIRIYRAVGFDGTETQTLLIRKPPGR
jgi:GNAT superfamily N-acetyltransferase